MSLKVLHIVEAMSAGVATAIEGYLDNSPDGIEHVVYGFRRPGVQVGDRVADKARVVELPEGKLAQLRAVRAAIRRERPDVVHAHSSWGGGYARLPLSMPDGVEPKIVFTGHCFSFERLDLGVGSRLFLKLAEELLAFNTDVFATAGRNEEALAAAMLARSEVIHLPYSLPSRLHEELRDLAKARTSTRFGTDEPVRACMVGRLSPQKAVPYFVDTVRAFERISDRPIEWTWIGGGDEDDAAALANVGVKVTGWTERSEALAVLDDADVYVHTAAWEGLPLTIIEAADLGLPIVARRIPALVETEFSTLSDTPEELARNLASLDDPEALATNHREVEQFVAEHLGAVQRLALDNIYAIATDEGRR